VKIRAAVLARTGAPLDVVDLDLAPPGPGEALIRLHASGVCHSDWNAVDGTAPTRCPAVLGHEGAGVVEAIGPGVERVAPGDHVALSWAPSCGRCDECLRDHRLRTDRDRVAVIGCGGVGLSALMAAVAVGAEPVIAVDAVPAKLVTATGFGATAGIAWAGGAEETAEAIREASRGGVDYAIEATGRPEAMLAAVLATRPRGAAVLIGIPAEDAVVPLPALTMPRMERRVLGSIYGSSKPERDFPATLDLWRAGRLPLERLVSHRLRLDEVGRGFQLMQDGSALRVVLDLTS